MARLPHMIKQRVSPGSVAGDHMDKEFDRLEAVFNSQSNAVNRLQQDLQKYKNVLDGKTLNFMHEFLFYFILFLLYF